MLQKHVSAHNAQEKVDDLIQPFVSLAFFEVLSHHFEKLMALDRNGFSGCLFFVHEGLECLVSAALELLSRLKGLPYHVVHLSFQGQQRVDQIDWVLAQHFVFDYLVTSIDQIRLHLLSHLRERSFFLPFLGVVHILEFL